MLRGSFIAPREIRDQRDLTRLRAVVVSDLLGVSGRAMILAMVKGETNPEVLAESMEWAMQLLMTAPGIK